eukprot:TRINITY_DN6995_c0_g1_i1.p1 TRINITY_DN6995_c0_g1~~TRINITY_DN6995_c0_g1_i1.p1  ORF type:complete len:650 (+),score=86.40 TRINITY_DN6995_c0_g1_i1:47-1996(+)
MLHVSSNPIQNVPLEAWFMWAVTLVNVTNVIIYASVQIYRAWTSGACRRLCPAVRSWCRLWFDGVKHYSRGTGQDDAFERKVRALADEARKDRARQMTRLHAHVAFGISLCVILAFGYYDPTLWFDLERTRWEISQSNYLQLTFIFAVTTYGWLFPDKMTLWTSHLWHCLIFVRFCWQVSTTQSIYALWALEQTQGAIRFWAAMCIGTPRVTMGLNIIMSLCKVWMYNLWYEALDDEEQHFVYMTFGSIKPFAFHEVFLCSMTWSVAVIIDTWAYAAVRANLQAKASSTSETTVKSMLVVLCDVVMTVDEDLNFNNPATEVAQFLLRQPHSNSYQGMCFLDLMEEADRDLIRHQILSSLIGVGTTLSLSARLVDGNGNLMHVQMYCTCFLDINDNRGYVIGILELRDPATAVRQDTISLVEADESLNGIRGSGTLNAAVEWGGDADSFKTYDTVESVPLIPLVNDEEEIEIWINLADDTIPIVDVSRLVRTMTGPESCIGVSFLEWLSRCEAAEVVGRISEGFAHFMEEPKSSMAVVDIGEIHLRPSHARRAGLEYLTRMQMDMTRLLLESNPSADGPVCVCLRPEDISVQKFERNKKKKAESSLPCLQRPPPQESDGTSSGSLLPGGASPSTGTDGTEENDTTVNLRL